jgi:hypothetical protein
VAGALKVLSLRDFLIASPPICFSFFRSHET